ncbi:hypothetical protein ABIA29_004565 [Bradyrhizobium japonicum]
MLQKGREGVGQNLVGAVADEHLLGRNIAIRRDRLAQARGARIWIKAQPLPSRRDRRQHARRGRIGILVGIELDDAILLGLLARDVGRQRVDDGTPEAAHDLQSRLILAQ